MLAEQLKLKSADGDKFAGVIQLKRLFNNKLSW